MSVNGITSQPCKVAPAKELAQHMFMSSSLSRRSAQSPEWQGRPEESMIGGIIIIWDLETGFWLFTRRAWQLPLYWWPCGQLTGFSQHNWRRANLWNWTIKVEVVWANDSGMLDINNKLSNWDTRKALFYLCFLWGVWLCFFPWEFKTKQQIQTETRICRELSKWSVTSP